MEKDIRQENKPNFSKRFSEWREKRRLKMDLWSRKKPFRRKMYLNRELYVMMFPYLLLFTTFTVIPVLMSLGLSFTDFNLLEWPPGWVGWENYLNLFLEDPIFITALKNTLIIAVIVGPGGYLLSFVFAWLINELPRYLRAVVTFVFYAPALTGAISIWRLIFFSDYYGWANSLLMKLQIIREPITWLKDPQYILPIVILVQLWMSLGVNFLAIIGGLKTVNKELYEAGAIDGVKNRWQELWFITLPSIKDQLLFSAVIQIANTLGVGAVTTALCGFPSVQYAGHTIVNHLTDYTSTRFELGYASAIATLLFLASIGLNSLIRKMIRKVGS
ncbi:MAG TPA: sugar ABC transporter permease [Bacilli bacterium]|jgi:multiple sugar transport system permease protein|nr:sugar ABC transporter permease [Bacilli bacterium]HOH62064.1 sugar ABC transporter permease [Bacilli bacterium]HPB48930.1 sugar ABC transporter permease [Bacilli bacterium]HPM14804.1 sugar ABC transporter permease [Bacilli bacterium]HPY55186.1 sugar ABC transporter permease [Bacilli bacterium]